MVIGDEQAVLGAKQIELAQGLTLGRVARAEALVGPHKDLTQQLDTVEFITAQHGTLRHIHERQRAQIALNQRYVGRQPRN
jgi:hypothetical protein